MLFNYFAQAGEVPTLTASDSSGLEALLGGSVFITVALAILVLSIVATWKIFVKAGKPGWAALIPFYNIYMLVKISGHPGWWVLLYFVPIVNFVISVIVSIDLGRKFGKDPIFSVVLLWLLGIGLLILAFDSSKYDAAA